MEKKMLDNMGVDQRAIDIFDKYLRTSTRASILEIGMTSNFQKTFVDNTISAMKCYEEYVKLMLSSYTKMLEYTTVFFPKKM
jgi:hypothetical protein